jgi:hypothetical protein
VRQPAGDVLTAKADIAPSLARIGLSVGHQLRQRRGGISGTTTIPCPDFPARRAVSLGRQGLFRAAQGAIDRLGGIGNRGDRQG